MYYSQERYNPFEFYPNYYPLTINQTVPEPPDLTQEYINRVLSINPTSLNPREFVTYLAHLSNIAYLFYTNPLGSSFQNDNLYLLYSYSLHERPTYPIVHPRNIIGLGSSQGEYGPTVQGFVLDLSSSPNPMIIISLRGTYTIADIATDVASQQVPIVSEREDILVHRGFRDLLTNGPISLISQIISILNFIKTSNPAGFSNASINVTGHSLGGALATITSMIIAREFPEKVGQIYEFTFGSPRVGNSQFALCHDCLVITNRYVNPGDPVPRFPFGAMGYKHVGRSPLLTSFEENADSAGIDYTRHYLVGQGAYIPNFTYNLPSQSRLTNLNSDNNLPPPITLLARVPVSYILDVIGSAVRRDTSETLSDDSFELITNQNRESKPLRSSMWPTLKRFWPKSAPAYDSYRLPPDIIDLEADSLNDTWEVISERELLPNPKRKCGCEIQL